MAGTISGIDWVSRMPATGTYTATADDATANQVLINTGKANAASFIVQILSSDVVVGGDAAISLASGVLTVADGSTYNTVAGDVINWIAF